MCNLYFIYFQDYIDAIEELPEFDKPSYFGLPENIERSAQRIVSSQVISQLKVLQRADVKASKFDKEVWANELGPVLNLWKKLNSVSILYYFKPHKLEICCRTYFMLFSSTFYFTFHMSNSYNSYSNKSNHYSPFKTCHNDWVLFIV